MEYAIELKNLSKTFARGSYQVFSGVNLRIPRGKITFILGPSGAGKSVTLKHVLGILKPDAGEVLVFNQHIPYDSPEKLSQMRKRFGMLFQSAALFDDMTVFQNVAFPLMEHRRNMPLEDVKQKVTEKLIAVGLDPKATLQKYPNELSGGMKKRVGLARAIILEPEILLYDEPTTGLDPMTRAMVDDLIIETNEKFGLTSVVISHDLPSALYSADYMAFLYKGKFVFFGTPEEFKKCDHEMIQAFLRSEERHRKEVHL
ncbi:MAG: ABC transporter ATP-binding protein [Bacteriovoracia bacterium]